MYVGPLSSSPTFNVPMKFPAQTCLPLPFFVDRASPTSLKTRNLYGMAWCFATEGWCMFCPRTRTQSRHAKHLFRAVIYCTYYLNAFRLVSSSERTTNRRCCCGLAAAFTFCRRSHATTALSVIWVYFFVRIRPSFHSLAAAAHQNYRKKK